MCRDEASGARGPAIRPRTKPPCGWVRRKQFSNNRLNHDIAHGYQALALDERRHHFRVSHWDDNAVPADQTIEQVWFPGSHGDVGGQEADRRISDITLEWMPRHAEDKGLKLRPDWRESLSTNHSGEIRRSDRHIWRLSAKDCRTPDGAKIHQSVLQRMADTDNGHQFFGRIPCAITTCYK